MRPNPTSLGRLPEVLAAEDCILFIGSGISRSAGLPDWSGLIQALADFVDSHGASSELIRREVERQDLLQAASFGVDALTRQQFRAFLHEVLRPEATAPSAVHRRIVELGPSCFVTTNYDHLVEEALRSWRPDLTCRIVTNRQVPETADIVQAQATNFVFKPHGDLHDIQSVVLTREHYRQLLNERPHVVHALNTLMVSRPVVYLGFGLRDPDFLLIKDAIASTYGGAARDHYAIAPDVSAHEVEYWRRNYGLILVSYETRKEADGSRSHEALTLLLDNLKQQVAATRLRRSKGGQPASHTLALARHAARVLKARPEDLAEPLPVTVSLDRHQPDGVRIPRPLEFASYSVAEFLGNVEMSCVLLGAPGSGKTYAIRAAAAEMALRLSSACLEETDEEQTPPIPIYVDLRAYRGSFAAMVSEALPVALDLDTLIASGSLVVFLDSFNEMPRHFVEAGDYAEDLQSFLERLAPNPVVVASRSDEGLVELGLPLFRLEDLEHRFVLENLPTGANELPKAIRDALVKVLSKPYLFKIYMRYCSDVKQPSFTKPHELFELVLANVERVCAEKLGRRPSLRPLLSSVGYWAIDSGSELIPIELVQACLKSYQAACIELDSDVDALEILLAEGLLVPAPGGRVSFVHQSLTEYLAASELARRFQANPRALRLVVESRRWDYSILLTLGFLDEESSMRFVTELIGIDSAFAIRAVALMEYGRSKATTRLLEALCAWEPASWTDFAEGAHQMTRLEATEAHLPILRKLIAKGDLIGAAAAKLAIDVAPEKMKDKILELILEGHEDYNFATGTARAIEPFLTEEDRQWLLDSIVSRKWTPGTEGFPGLSTSVGLLLADADPEGLVKRVEQTDDRSQALIEVVVKAIDEKRSTARLAALARLFILAPAEVVFSLYSQLRWGEYTEEETRSSISDGVLPRLLAMIRDGGEKAEWAAECYRILITKWRIGASLLEKELLQSEGLHKLVLAWCLHGAGSKFEEVANSLPSERLIVEWRPNALSAIPGDVWLTYPDVLMGLLALRDSTLGMVVLASLQYADAAFPALDLGDVNPWCEWLEEEAKKEDSEAYWLVTGLGAFLARAAVVDGKIRQQLIDMFNRSDSPSVFGNYVISRIPGVELGDLSEEVVTMMIELLETTTLSEYPMPLLAVVGTKRFYRTRLEPLLGQDNPVLDRNIRLLGSLIGRRLGTRFTVQEGNAK